jgi:hypothetical protein
MDKRTQPTQNKTLHITEPPSATLQPGASNIAYRTEYGFWKLNEDADFVTRVLWTNKSHCSQVRKVDTQNIHRWVQENAHFPRKRESCNIFSPVTCGSSGEYSYRSISTILTPYWSDVFLCHWWRITSAAGIKVPQIKTPFICFRGGGGFWEKTFTGFPHRSKHTHTHTQAQ